MQYIILGGGCFWCIEAVYNRIEGVTSAISGYAGGKTPNPTYKDICKGDTGHAEVVKVTFDEHIIPLEEILEIFWSAHDPTTLNRQGNDIGTQYRSVIYYQNDDQLATINASIERVAKPIWGNNIVTEVVPEPDFYVAEAYHQDYYAGNSMQPYCAVVISPKLNKIRQKFSSKIKIS